MPGSGPLGERRGRIHALRLDRFDLTGRSPKGGRPVFRFRPPARVSVGRARCARSAKADASKVPNQSCPSRRRDLEDDWTPVERDFRDRAQRPGDGLRSRFFSFLNHESRATNLRETTITRLGDSRSEALSDSIARLPWPARRPFGFSPVSPICLRSCRPQHPFLPTPITVSRDMPPPGSSAHPSRGISLSD